MCWLMTKSVKYYVLAETYTNYKITRNNNDITLMGQTAISVTDVQVVSFHFIYKRFNINTILWQEYDLRI